MSVPEEESYGWEVVPLYGKVRTIIRSHRGVSGPPLVLLDLDYQPELPEGALRGNPRECAPFCNFCNVPKYFYLDEERLCLQCGEPFVFRAEEQKHWFEERKFHIRTKCVRCPACRKTRYTQGTLKRRLSETLADLAEEPENELLNLVAAEALVRHIEGVGEGDLSKAMALARRARRESELYPESWYWEGRVHELSGRRLRAREAYEEFLALSEEAVHLNELRERAEAQLSSEST